MIFFSAIAKSLAHVNEGLETNRLPRDNLSNSKTAMPKMSNALHEIRDWWCEQLVNNCDDD